MKISISQNLLRDPELKERTLLLKALLLKYEKLIARNIRHRPNVRVRIHKIRDAWGLSHYDKNLIEIDPRQGLRKSLEVAFHEFVHSEQYYQGRLKINYANVWNEKEYPEPVNYGQYYRSPWEVEARRRAKVLIRKVWPNSSSIPKI